MEQLLFILVAKSRDDDRPIARDKSTSICNAFFQYVKPVEINVCSLFLVSDNSDKLLAFAQ